MKVQNIKDIEAFKTVDSCEGKVELVTGEGDRFESEIQAFSVCFYGKYFLKRRDYEGFKIPIGSQSRTNQAFDDKLIIKTTDAF